ncbi:hypothetical protein Nepgr_004524 [Nepenthes gracilis]|uniref:G domain-containing protein n=1 Tax=Nepenthes gracilis TaxID=150966 RepID=A0AAD3XFD4_NEPGR|nr:hypothetical protein Nepgr_004524 [Nepenthes gracilis]
MVPLSSLTSTPCLPTTLLFLKHSLPAYNTHNYFPNFKYPPSNTRRFSRYSVHTNLPVPNNDPKDPYPPSKLELRTLYPGGFKRPEIKVPSIVLQLTVDEVLSDGSVLDVVDEAVCKWVGIVVVMGGEGGGGGRLYQAACWLKSVIRDRAYLLIAERVDIAAAVNASGVVLSDQGLPTIVARNTLMGSKSESVILPVVGRCVQTVDAAVSASKSEGADFLIYSTEVEEHTNVPIQSMCANVKAPIFTTTTLNEDTVSFDLASRLLRSGASGLVITLRTLKLSMGDTLSKLLSDAHTTNNRSQDKVTRVNKFKMLDVIDGLAGEKGVAGFVKLEHREVQFIKKERWILLEAINVIQKAAPLMEEASLLKDAVAQLDEPFLLVIVGEFNSGKSTVINALLGGRFLKDGVVPTTNEITFLRYSECDSNEQQRFERHPDGRFICYLPAQILKDMVIVDTPGTNVILQRQQRLTEEFVPRADLLLFVISADRPLTESEVTFLRYTQQWKKKVIFVLNKSDLYQNASELKEAVTFVKENIQRLLNAEHVTLYPVSARSALEAKILSSDVSRDYTKLSMTESYQSIQNFLIFEKFLFSFLDGSTSNGLERIKIKLETPIRIAERLLSACQTVVTQDSRYAQQDLASLEELFNSIKQYSMKMESESNSWRRRILTLVDTTEALVLKLVESTLQLSNLDLAASFVFKGKKSASMPATLSLQNDIIGPMLWDAQKLLGEYSAWLRTSTTCEAKQYKESLKKRWPSFFDAVKAIELESNALIKVDDLSLKSIEKYNATAASKLFDQEIREVFLGAFGGLGAAGLSASLLTSVLPTTLEDLLALGLCSAGGLLAISNFPARRQRMVDKVKRIADAVACEVEGAMEEELSETIKELNNLVQVMGKPYQEAAQDRVDKLAEIQGELSDVGRKLLSLQIELQNFHLS